MVKIGLYLTVCLLGACVLTACQKYRVTLNERPLYQPPALIDKIALADTALETCVEQIITDQRITELKNLQRLRCSNAGIQSIAGLEQLTWLQELDVSSNDLRQIDSLFKLEHLRRLRLVENANLNCAQMRQLKAENQKLTIEAPAHCENT